MKGDILFPCTSLQFYYFNISYWAVLEFKLFEKNQYFLFCTNVSETKFPSTGTQYIYIKFKYLQIFCIFLYWKSLWRSANNKFGIRKTNCVKQNVLFFKSDEPNVHLYNNVQNINKAVLLRLQNIIYGNIYHFNCLRMHCLSVNSVFTLSVFKTAVPTSIWNDVICNEIVHIDPRKVLGRSNGFSIALFYFHQASLRYLSP